MIKPVLAATLLCLTAGCYSTDSAQVLVPPIVTVAMVEKEDLPSFLIEEEKPFGDAVLSGSPSADQHIVCALRFTENNALAALGLPPTSPIVEKYVLTYGLTEVDYALLSHSCGMFDMGILFWSLTTSPPTPLPSEEMLPWDSSQ